jgi:ATP-binding cassette subfamily C protein
VSTHTSGQLPVAGPADVRKAAFRLVRADRRAFGVVLALNALAAAAGLAGPWLLGSIIDDVRGGGGVRAVDRLALWILLCSLAQLLLARWARYVGHRFGERTLARVREEFVDRTLAPGPNCSSTPCSCCSHSSRSSCWTRCSASSGCWV